MSETKQKWRLILSPANSGPLNMAIDEILLRSCQASESVPILRFYSWSPPCLSLGRAQSIVDIDLEKLNQSKWDIVRRPTGGKGILHIDELTYSVIANANHPIMTGGVLPSYQRISSVLIYAMNKIGIRALAKELVSPIHPNPLGPVCFETPSNYEIMANGKKLIGSAQARKGEGVLQHGAIPLFGDISRIVTVLKINDPGEIISAKNNILSRATTIQEAAGILISPEMIISAILEGFDNLFNIAFSESSLSKQETQNSNDLLEEKYSDATWITRI